MCKSKLFRLVVLSACGLSLLLAVYQLGLKPEKPLDIVFISKTHNRGVAFWNAVMLGVEAAEKEFGVNIRITGPAEEYEVDTQNKLIHAAIDEKPDIIILAAASYTGQEELCQAVHDAGITLVTVDSDIESGNRESFVGTDNFEAGRVAGTAFAKLLPEDGLFAVISFVEGTAPAIDREQGVLSALSDRQRANSLGTYYCSGLEGKAYAIVVELLREHPGLSGLICLNEPSATGSVLALRAMDRTDVDLVGIDSSLSTIKALEEGIADTLVVQNPFNMGYLSVAAAIDAYHGKKVEPFINTGAKAITQKTMYDPENQKLLFIFADAPGAGGE